MRLFIFAVAFIFSVSSAHAERTIEFAATAEPGDAVIAAVSDANDLAALDALIGADAAAALARAVKTADFNAREGETESFFTGAERFGEIHLVGVGKDGLRSRDLEDFGGRAAAIAAKSKAPRVTVLPPADGAEAAASVAFGAALGQYTFDLYDTKRKERKKGALAIVSGDSAGARQIWEGEKRHVAEAVKWARDQQSEPANVLYPEEFVARARAAFRGVPKISVTVLDVSAMQRLGMGAILGVGRGSERPPRMLIVDYRGGGDEAPIVFAGKGITFDSGGISLKGKDGMWTMKSDMTGAAAVTAAVMGLAKSGAPVNVVAVAALAENMPSGSAIRPGDVLRTMSGKTIEVMSTDAEGRLVLSDAIWYAQQEYAPQLLIDVATLTGSVSTALSDEYAGLFAREDEVAERLLAAGEAAGEDLWRLPLHANYDKQIRSDIADVKNGDAGNPGAGIGAAFIGTFVRDETPWAHLDIAGVDWRSSSLPTVPKGASGFSVRLLDRLARDSAG